MKPDLGGLVNYPGFSIHTRRKKYGMFVVFLVLFNMISDNIPGIAMVGGHRP